MNQKDIITYYDESKIAYQDAWHLDNCMALHYGFWGDGVKNLQQALIHENNELARLAKIRSGDLVLDAGCGVGGSSIFLAREIGCEVRGITLSQDQVASAESAALIHKVSDKCSFHKADFHSTDFPDETFDVVWFVESFCHSNEPQDLLKEMYRVLKPGGRIIIADGFQTRAALDESEKELLDSWLNNWAVDHLVELSSMDQYMKEAGFANIESFDYTNQIKRSARRLFVFGRLALANGKLRKAVGRPYVNEIRIKNSVGAKFQYLCLKKGLWSYNVFIAEKAN